MTSNVYEVLAALLAYPAEGYLAQLDRACELGPAPVAEALVPFAAAVHGLSTSGCQELFTRTFDLNPVCSLELGWHLFGENYDRGIMLVKMREQLRAHEIAENGELPDHLTHALLLIARMPPDTAADFAAACVLPALQKMLAAVQGKNNPYEGVLLAVERLLHVDFPDIPLIPAGPASLPVLPEGVPS